VFNIPVSGDKLTINENSIPGEEGMNDFKKTGYGGPCPPGGTHRYFFRAYALDTTLNLSFATKADVELAMKNHVLAKGELMGKFR
jgi:Raf kinase inhibitor-like YbhB/YbcL family protein